MLDVVAVETQKSEEEAIFSGPRTVAWNEQAVETAGRDTGDATVWEDRE